LSDATGAVAAAVCAADRGAGLSSPRPACGERHRPPSAAVLRRTPKQSFGYVASAMRSIVRCNPGEGVQVYRLEPTSRIEPLTPTLICARLGVRADSRIVFGAGAAARRGD